MTTAVIALSQRRVGLFAPTGSSGRSDSAVTLARILEQTRSHLWASFSISVSTEAALDDLDAVQLEASFEGWNGYGGMPIQPASYEKAQYFLQALPLSLPRPEITVAGDGEVAFDWTFKIGVAMTIRIGANGRLTFAWMNGQRTYSGTDWLDDGIPATIADALSILAQQTKGVTSLGTD